MASAAAPRAGSIALFLLVLLAADGLVVAALQVSDRSQPVPSHDRDHLTVSASQLDLNWAFCQVEFDNRPVTPRAVAITYLDPELDTQVTPNRVRSWLGPLAPQLIDVYQLEYRTGRRRIALELIGSKWARWAELAGNSEGRELCGRVRAGLLAAGIGRPSPSDETDRSRHDFDFIYERRATLYQSRSWLGTGADLLKPDQFAAAQRWLSGTLEPL